MHIELDKKEQTILDEIILDAREVRGPEAAQANGARVCELMHLLLEREAIPECRINYFVDPACNIGGHGKSRRQAFRTKRNTDKEIFEHLHFLAYLRYFLFGPKLPEPLQHEFSAAVEDCGMITSGDIIPLAEKARDLARRFGLGKESHEEFFKLALEQDLSPEDARFARDKVRAIR